MSKWIYGGHHTNSGVTLARNDVFFYPLSIDQGSGVTPEAGTQLLIQASVTASNLWANITAVSGTLTIRSRKNGANGNQVISATTTGAKEDTTNTDSLATNDLICISFTMSGSHGDTATFQAWSLLLDDSGNDTPHWLSCNQGNSSSWSQGADQRGLISGSSQGYTNSEADSIVRASATLSKLSLYLNTNTLNTSNPNFTFQINGSDGNQVVAVTAGVTGRFSDTTHSDAVVAGNIVRIRKAVVSGTGTAAITQINLLASSAKFRTLLAIANAGNSFSTANTTTFASLCGRLVDGITEANAQISTRVADVFKNLQCNVTANSRSDITTITFRANTTSPSGGPALSISSGSTGIIEDLTGSYTSGTTDLVAYRVVIGAGTGSITITQAGVQQGVGTSVTPLTVTVADDINT